MQHSQKTPHERLREARIEADLSQTALAEILGVHQSLISKIETECRTPGARVRLKIKTFAGIGFEEWP